MSQVYNGDISTWEYSIQSVGTPESDNANYQFFNTYLFPYMKGIKECKPYDKDCEIKLDPNTFENPNYTANTYSMYILTDGSCFGILTGGVWEIVFLLILECQIVEFITYQKVVKNVVICLLILGKIS